MAAETKYNLCPKQPTQSRHDTGRTPRIPIARQQAGPEPEASYAEDHSVEEADMSVYNCFVGTAAEERAWASRRYVDLYNKGFVKSPAELVALQNADPFLAAHLGTKDAYLLQGTRTNNGTVWSEAHLDLSTPTNAREAMALIDGNPPKRKVTQATTAAPIPSPQALETVKQKYGRLAQIAAEAYVGLTKLGREPEQYAEAGRDEAAEAQAKIIASSVAGVTNSMHLLLAEALASEATSTKLIDATFRLAGRQLGELEELAQAYGDRKQFAIEFREQVSRTRQAWALFWTVARTEQGGSSDLVASGLAYSEANKRIAAIESRT
jgi:hypothetical protein